MTISHIVKLPIDNKASFTFNREGGSMGIPAFSTEIGPNGSLLIDFGDTNVNQAFYFLSMLGSMVLNVDDGISVTFPVSLDIGSGGTINIRLSKTEADFVPLIPDGINVERVELITQSSSTAVNGLKATSASDVDERLVYLNQIYSQWKPIADLDPKNTQAKVIVAKAGEIIERGANSAIYEENLSALEQALVVDYYDWKAQYNAIYDANRSELKKLLSEDISVRRNAADIVIAQIESLPKPAGLLSELGFFGGFDLAQLLGNGPGSFEGESHANICAAWHDYAILVRENTWYNSFDQFMASYV